MKKLLFLALLFWAVTFHHDKIAAVGRTSKALWNWAGDTISMVVETTETVTEAASDAKEKLVKTKKSVEKTVKKVDVLQKSSEKASDLVDSAKAKIKEITKD